MSASPAGPASAPRPLHELLAAMDDATAALVAWDLAAFDKAVERQSTLCDALVAAPPAVSALDADAARRVLQQSRAYRKLLQHSMQWTRTLGAILDAAGPSNGSRASFRG